MNKINLIKPLLTTIIIAACLLTSNLHLNANDASWGYDETISNLVLLQQEDIAMVSEELYISLDKIEVKYVFENKSDKDISTIVGFPFPNQLCKYEECKEIVLNGEEGRSYGFEVWINDKQIEPQVRSSENYKEIAYWQQVFPAKRQIRIRHTYEPNASGNPYAGYEYTEEDDYCSTPEIEKRQAAEAIEKEKTGKRPLIYQNFFDYILTTGGYWAGGEIGDFKLFIDAKEEDALVSICGFDLTKTSPTTYQWQQKNFRPTKDLKILFYGGSHMGTYLESR